MKTIIAIFLILISHNLKAQIEERNNIKIEKNELGIARDFNFDYRLLKPGFYSKDSLPIITIYNLDERNLKLEFEVYSKHGKGFDIILSSDYQFKEELIQRLSRQKGPAPILYIDYVLEPEIRSAARTAIGKYSYDGLDKNQSENEILNLLKSKLDSGIIVNSAKIEVINKK